MSFEAQRAAGTGGEEAEAPDVRVPGAGQAVPPSPMPRDKRG